MDSLSIKEAAEELGLSHDTVTRLVKSKKLIGKPLNPFALTSPVFISRSEIERFKKVRNDKTELQTKSLA